jgi:hypothetical protein
MQPELSRARYYWVSAANYPIEKYLLCRSAEQAAEEFAALFDLGDLFDEVVVDVSLSDPRGGWSTRRFVVASAHVRVYEAMAMAEPEEEIYDADALGATLEEPIEVAVGEDDAAAQSLSAAAAAEYDDPAAQSLETAIIEDTPTILRPLALDSEVDSDDDPDPTDPEPVDSETSGFRRLAERASRSYSNMVRGLFGRRRARGKAA